MMDLAFGLLVAAGMFGGLLAVLYLRGPAVKPVHRAAPLAHGAIGAGGLVLLILAVRYGAVTTGMGTAGFAPTAAGLIALALICGLVIGWTFWRGRRPGGGLVGAHASLAIAGIVLLLALVALN